MFIYHCCCCCYQSVLLIVFFGLLMVWRGEGEPNSSMILQPAGVKGLERSALVRRLLLVSTIDGNLYAFDKYSGALYWQNDGLGGSTIKGSYAKSQGPTDPIYFVEPQGLGYIYAYIPGAGVKKLPIHIKGLVNQSPVHWPDGTFFTVHKTLVFFALDITSGKVLFKYEFESTGGGGGMMSPSSSSSSPTCPTDGTLESFSGNSRSIILIARTEYLLSCFPIEPSNFQSKSWNVTFSEYTGFMDPFNLSDHDSSSPLNNREETDEDGQYLYSSFNGMIAARDKFTKQLMWVRQLKSIAISFFKLSESGGGGEHDSIGAILVKVPISPFTANSIIIPSYSLNAGGGEEVVNIGDENGTLFVLPNDYFPIFRTSEQHDYFENFKGEAGLVPVKFLSDYNRPILPIERDTFDDLCKAGHPDFPKCLLGRRMAQVIQPIPLLPFPNDHSLDKKSVTLWRLAFTLFITCLSFIMTLLYVWKWKRPSSSSPSLPSAPLTLITSPSIIGKSPPPPPGFEEISISSADIFYSVQSSENEISPPKSFLVSEEIIGYGSHGTVVFKGYYDERPVAVKRILVDFYDLAGHEVNLLQQSDHHPNVIRYFCRENTKKFTFIVLELCECSLADLIESSDDMREKVEMSTLLDNPQSMLKQVCLGLAHLHDLKLVHRDMKPHNILITPQKRLVISDFGLGKKLTEGQSSFHPTIQGGTIGWRAPECILSEEAAELSKINYSSPGSERVRISKSVDIFALGCIFYYVLSKGDHPFGSRLQREMNIISNQFNISKVENTHPEAADLILRMIDRRSDKRPNCQQVLAHPYFWSAQKQVAFLQDLSDRFESEDRKPSSEILAAFERKRRVIFEGGASWSKLLDVEVWRDLCSYRKYNSHSARDLLRALRNKRNHFHELSPEIRKVLGETPEAFMSYFLLRFPRLLIEAYHLVESTNLRDENPFSATYFVG